MKKFMSISLFFCLSQFSFANNKNEIQKVFEAEGCYYADIIYKPGEKHLVQEQVLEPSIHKITPRDAKPEIWQECADGKKDGVNASSRFYWKTLSEKK